MNKKRIVEFSDFGFLSKQNISLSFEIDQTLKETSFFSVENQELLEANLNYVVSSQRNTVLGTKKTQIFFVEHLLAAISLLRIKKLKIKIVGSEIPLIDGSALKWLEILQVFSSSKNSPDSDKKKLKKTLHFESKNKEQTIIAYPSDFFKVVYLFECPVTKRKQWSVWQEQDGIKKVGQARTFAPLEENKILGTLGKWLSYDQSGFDQDLRFKEEPAYHKILDLIGDLSLTGFNPLDLGVSLICLKSGHELNNLLAKKLQESLLPVI